jgi:hypothetical protein
MKRTVCLVLVVILLAAVGVNGTALRLQSIGLRFAISLGDRPPYWGFDVGWETSFGWLNAVLLVSPEGTTILGANGSVALWGRGDPFTTFVMLSVLVGFLDPPSLYPTPAVGGGLGVRLTSAAGLWGDARAQLLYPLAFSPPWISVGAGWSP